MSNKSIVFLGDIASPTETTSLRLDQLLTIHEDVFSNKILIGNLEGLISSTNLTNSPTPILYNHTSIVPVLKRHNFKALGIANNHTLDKPELFESTSRMLLESGIQISGAGLSKSIASEPAIFQVKDQKFVLINASWHLLQQHQRNPNKGLYANEIEEETILSHVTKIRSDDKEIKIIAFFHWSFDLETLPFPMYRSFSRDLIDAGVDLVVGTHSHCPQGGEKYKGKHIVYGLGNFFVPWFTFINGTIHFPEISRIQLAFEWDFETDEAYCHWFKYKDEKQGHNLELIESDLCHNSKLMEKYAPYAGMDEEEYLNYFIKNRRKRFLVPVYKSYKNKKTNKLNDFYLKARMSVLRQLAKSGLREWNN